VAGCFCRCVAWHARGRRVQARRRHGGRGRARGRARRRTAATAAFGGDAVRRDGGHVRQLCEARLEERAVQRRGHAWHCRARAWPWCARVLERRRAAKQRKAARGGMGTGGAVLDERAQSAACDSTSRAWRAAALGDGRGTAQKENGRCDTRWRRLLVWRRRGARAGVAPA
jgi:hypothetical protein